MAGREERTAGASHDIGLDLHLGREVDGRPDQWHCLSPVGHDHVVQVQSWMVGDFIMERKIDGYRAICHKDGDKITWTSRSMKELPVAKVLDDKIRKLIKAERCGCVCISPGGGRAKGGTEGGRELGD